MPLALTRGVSSQGAATRSITIIIAIREVQENRSEALQPVLVRNNRPIQNQIAQADVDALADPWKTIINPPTGTRSLHPPIGTRSPTGTRALGAAAQGLYCT